MNPRLTQNRKPSVSWPVLWVCSAGATAIGVLLLYLDPYLAPLGKGSVPAPLLFQAPQVVIAIGMLGIVVASAGIVKSRWPESLSLPTRRPVRLAADAGAIGALVIAVAALMTVILVEFVWPTIQANFPAGPCDQDPTVACFSAHPNYYQEIGSGDYSTPISRIGHDIVTPALLATWPLGLAASVTSLIVLAIGTRHRRVAIIAMILGSLTVLWIGAGYLAFLVFGGGD